MDTGLAVISIIRLNFEFFIINHFYFFNVSEIN